MAEEPDSTEEVVDPLARPLPSVKMPLLADQVRAAQMRQRVSIGLLAFGLLAFGAYQWLSGEPEDESGDEAIAADTGDDDASEESTDEAGAVEEEDDGYLPPIFADRQPKEEVEEPAEAEPDDEVAEAPAPAGELEPPTVNGAVQRTRTLFGEARGFRPALLQAGLQSSEAVQLEQALDGTLDFRRCHTSDALVVERDADGDLLLFEYHDEPTSFVRVLPSPDGSLSASRIEVPLEIQTVTKGGTIRSSLGNAINDVGLGRNIAGLFIEVFEGEVNFSTQARAGDTFRLVIDEERIGGEFLRWGQVRAIEYIGQRAGELRAFYFEPRGERGDWFNEEGRAIRGGWLRVPCRYDRISSPFNPRRMHPILRRISPHNGTDFAASTGTPVWAAADGVVTWAGPKGPNGNLVSIRHARGYSTHYAHLHQIQRGIREGVTVTQRQLIGTVGTTGRSTGPHLHFGLKRNNRFMDAMAVINGPGELLPAAQRGAFRRRMQALRQELDRIQVNAPEIAPPEERAPDSEATEEVLD